MFEIKNSKQARYIFVISIGKYTTKKSAGAHREECAPAFCYAGQE